MSTVVCQNCETHSLVILPGSTARAMLRHLHTLRCPLCTGRLRRWDRRCDPHRPAFPVHWTAEQRLHALNAIVGYYRAGFGMRRWAAEEIGRLEGLARGQVTGDRGQSKEPSPC